MSRDKYYSLAFILSGVNHMRNDSKCSVLSGKRHQELYDDPAT